MTYVPIQKISCEQLIGLRRQARSTKRPHLHDLVDAEIARRLHAIEDRHGAHIWQAYAVPGDCSAVAVA